MCAGPGQEVGALEAIKVKILTIGVGRCRLTLSTSVLKAPMVSVLEASI